MTDDLDLSAFAGTWYLRIAGVALSVSITWDAVAGYRGMVSVEDGSREELDEITWDSATGGCELRRHGREGWQWLRATVVAGILSGRCSQARADDTRPALSAYQLHVTGWHSTSLDEQSVPRVYDLVLGTHTHACLRLDRDVDGHLLGRLKVVVTRDSADATWDAAGEDAASANVL